MTVGHSGGPLSPHVEESGDCSILGPHHDPGRPSFRLGLGRRRTAWWAAQRQFPVTLQCEWKPLFISRRLDVVEGACDIIGRAWLT